MSIKIVPLKLAETHHLILRQLRVELHHYKHKSVDLVRFCPVLTD